jgi:RNA polymerase sigma-70 factor, ECF subfamily
MKRSTHSVPQPAPADALGVVYREQFDFVWRSLLRLGMSKAAAEDAAQDVFLVVRRRLVDFDPSRSIRPWLFGIARRVASEHRRSSGRAERRLELLPPPVAEPGPDDRVSAVEANELVRRFLADLDDTARMIFVLSDLEGMSGTDISQALGINRNTVYSRLRKTRQRFEAKIRDELGENEVTS